MKVQVIFNGGYPIGTVATHRVHHMCKGLHEAGMDVELLLTHPSESKNDIMNTETKGICEGVPFRYISKNIIRKNNLFLRKMIDFFSHILVITQVLMNTRKNNFIIVIGPSLDFRIWLPVVNLLTRTKIFLEINEYPFLNKADSFKSRSKRWLWLNLVVPLYDGFIVISKDLDKLISKYKSKNAKNINVPILGDRVIDKRDCIAPLKERYIIHSGSLSEEKDGIIGVLKAYKLLLSKMEKEVKFVITGNTSYSPWNKEFHKFIKDNELSKHIVFTGFLSNEEMECYLKNSCLAVINKYDNLQNRYCFSTKLTEYLKYEVPIIATKVGALQAYLTNNLNAYLIEPNDIDVLVEAMAKVINNEEKVSANVKGGVALMMQDFNYAHQGNRLYEFFKSTTQSMEK